MRHTLAAQLIRHASTWRSADAVAERAGVPLQAVMAWWVDDRMFALTDAHGQPIFPDYAFDRSGQPRVIMGQLWGMFRKAQLGPWDIAAWMVLAQDRLGNEPPVACLEASASDLLLAASHTLLERALPPPRAPLYLA